MKLIQLLTTVGVQDLCDAHNAYREQPDGKYHLTPQWYRETFLPTIVNKVLENLPNSVLVLNYVETRHDDPVDDGNFFDVVMVDERCDRWSMSFMPWGQLLNMPVEDRTNLGLTDAQVAAHMLWELTWHGLEEEAEERRDELEDCAEELDRAILQHEQEVLEGSADKDSLPKGVGRMDEDWFDSLFSDETPEERVERKAALERHLINVRTCRTYCNGKLVEKSG